MGKRGLKTAVKCGGRSGVENPDYANVIVKFRGFQMSVKCREEI